MASLTGCALLRPAGPSEKELAAQSRRLSQWGMVALDNGRFEQAENYFQQAHEICPTNACACRHYADTLWRRGETEEAVATMRRAVALSGGDPALFVALGRMQYALGNNPAALKDADRALAGDPKLASAWTLKADVLYEQERLEDALVAYHRALSLGETGPQTQQITARIYARQGRHRRAYSAVAASLDRYPKGAEPPELLMMAGQSLAALGRYDRAIDTLLAATRREGAGPECFCQLAEVSLLAGREADARWAIGEALAQSPGFPPALELAAKMPSGPTRVARR